MVSDSLGYSDHSIVEFGIWLGLLKVSTKPKVLDFRRANFSSLKAHVAGSSGEREGGSVFWNFPWTKKHVNRLESIQRRETSMIRGFESLPYEEITGFAWP